MNFIDKDLQHAMQFCTFRIAEHGKRARFLIARSQYMATGEGATTGIFVMLVDLSDWSNESVYEHMNRAITSYLGGKSYPIKYPDEISDLDTVLADEELKTAISSLLPPYVFNYIIKTHLEESYPGRFQSYQVIHANYS